ncbi:FG-GAP and VCBS repeat-containing protein [Streptomyces sp. NPDC005438]|uniref:FG-GAP and VCBS repeat-containing protein n=1 Tax=Streptomyces sp. NPDC005438 TaxID=3156880 RepID=UPI0033BB7F92
MATLVVVGAAAFAWRTFGEADEDEAPRPRHRAVNGPASTEPLPDFDNDGVPDTYATARYGGAVFVVYGSRAGDGKGKGGGGDFGRRDRLTLDSPGVPGKDNRSSSFGEYHTARDLDGDGYTDLVASVESTGDDERRPGLTVLWGSKEGLKHGTSLSRTPKGYPDPNENAPVVAGDFDGDGHSDLVVGGARQKLLKGPFSRRGEPAGTDEVPNPFPSVGEKLELEGAYAGDLNGDGADDLVTSHTTEDDGVGGGQVRGSYLAGGPDGFRPPDTERLPGIETATTGDVDKDGYTDLVLRRYPKGVAPDSAPSGPVEVFHGAKDGPDPDRRTTIDQNSPGVPGGKTQTFGSALAAGDVDGDGHADVAVGTPMSLLDKSPSSVTVLRGGSEGLTGRGARRVEEPDSAPQMTEEDGTTLGNQFAGAVRLGDLDGDDRAELVVGAPNTGDHVGALWILPHRDGAWPEKEAHSYEPDDFPGSASRRESEMGAQVR